MKILLIDVNCKLGSTGKIVYDLFTELNQQGDTAAICYGRGKKIKEANIYKFGIDIETRIHALLTRITGLTGCFSFFSTHRLLKFIKKFKPDVVHIHELHAYFVNLKPVINYLKKNNIKTIWTFHCEFMYTGKCGIAYDCDKWKTQCGKCPYKKEYPSSWLFDRTKKMFQEKKKLFEGFDNLIIVTPSQWLADRVHLSFLKDKTILVIHNGIDTNIFRLQEFSELKEKLYLKKEKIILAVAPDLMSELKGGRWVLKLAENMKNSPVKFILIGVENTREKFPNNVIAIGRTGNQIELAQYYSMADVFVICSKVENFPTTCVEARCCGTEICGFDVGGVNETFPHTPGNFVAYRDVEQLSLKVTNILKQTSCDKEFLASSSCKEFSKSRMYNEYRQLYTQLNN